MNAKMKVLYDHQIFNAQKYGGISRYFSELINGFDENKDIQARLTLLVSNNHYISDNRKVKFISILPNLNFRGKVRIFYLLNKLSSILKLKRQNFDIFHPTYYDPYFLKYLKNIPYVLTVYDMIHEKFDYMIPSNDATSKNKKILVESATKIIAISESTKKDIIEIYGIDEAKIEVVYLANSLVYNQNFIYNIEIPKKYILFVGSRGGYKNFLYFVKSVREILKGDNELSILCAGGGKFTSFENKYFLELNISEQIFQCDLNDNNLAFLYKHAILFVFPSLYEGFGIPILEAFACECPLVCSNTSSLPEVAGFAAQYFDPYDENSIEDAIATVLNDKILRDKLIQDGKERLHFFSWKKTVTQTAEIYKSILQ
jgi:glycosyltransferase involved in cell wall biosynthesis